MKLEMLNDRAVRNLKPDQSGWTWEVQGVDISTDRPATITMRTNHRGEGMWDGDNQLLGTTQFRASSNREVTRRRIKRVVL